MTNKLVQLKQFSDVVADTGDIEAIARYQPLDATTNPSLLFKAAQMPQYQDLVKQTLASSASIGDAADKIGVAIGCEILKLYPAVYPLKWMRVCHSTPKRALPKRIN